MTGRRGGRQSCHRVGVEVGEEAVDGGGGSVRTAPPARRGGGTSSRGAGPPVVGTRTRPPLAAPPAHRGASHPPPRRHGRNSSRTQGTVFLLPRPLAFHCKGGGGQVAPPLAAPPRVSLSVNWGRSQPEAASAPLPCCRAGGGSLGQPAPSIPRPMGGCRPLSPGSLIVTREVVHVQTVLYILYRIHRTVLYNYSTYTATTFRTARYPYGPRTSGRWNTPPHHVLALPSRNDTMGLYCTYRIVQRVYVQYIHAMHTGQTRTVVAAARPVTRAGAGRAGA